MERRALPPLAMAMGEDCEEKQWSGEEAQRRGGAFSDYEA